MIYLAAPFFNEKQKAMIESVELTFDRADVEYFSPRSFGVIKDGCKIPFQEIYEKNIEMIMKSKMIIALTDDYDPGTVFEVGYAVGKDIPVITVTAEGYGINVMLRQCVAAHVSNLTDLMNAYNAYWSGESILQYMHTTEAVT